MFGEQGTFGQQRTVKDYAVCTDSDRDGTHLARIVQCGPTNQFFICKGQRALRAKNAPPPFEIGLSFHIL